jgi:hypothetical protein
MDAFSKKPHPDPRETPAHIIANSRAKIQSQTR